MADPPDTERNRFSARAARYARVGANMGGVAARLAGARLMGGGDSAQGAAALTAALGGLKGPIMKIAQFMSTIPDLLPPEYASSLATLQAEAPPMGAAFVTRRMGAELGPEWRDKFGSFDLKPAAAASLGQVHRATALDGTRLAVKLQYPEMQSAVEADLHQLDFLMALYRRTDPAIEPKEIGREIGERVREELDYRREARHAALYKDMLSGEPQVRVPSVWPALSTGRLLTLDWLDGVNLLAFKDEPLEVRNRLATAMFKAWWMPFSRFGVIHGDPHLGNYAAFSEDGRPGGINLLDYGCIRIFPPRFVGGVVELYRSLLAGDRDRLTAAFELWGFTNLSREVVDALSIWAGFIYGPLLEDRVRPIAEGIGPGEYGRREAFTVHQALKQHGPITIPREFVFMDRAAIGLGGVFLHLKAELNFYRLFGETIDGFSVEGVTERQTAALQRAGLPIPA